MKSERRLHMLISGQVQGVAFRAYTMRVARQLGVEGWVRNLHDGRVEVLAEGTQDSIEQLVTWCQDGPPTANVIDIEKQWLDFKGDLGPFAIRYS